MSDIKQAVLWLRQGRDTHRHNHTWWLTPYYPNKTTFAVVDANGKEHDLDTHDLLADDWEIAE